MNLKPLPGLGDHTFLGPSESYGFTADYQSMCVSTVGEGEEICQVI